MEYKSSEPTYEVPLIFQVAQCLKVSFGLGPGERPRIRIKPLKATPKLQTLNPKPPTLQPKPTPNLLVVAQTGWVAYGTFGGRGQHPKGFQRYGCFS